MQFYTPMFAALVDARRKLHFGNSSTAVPSMSKPYKVVLLGSIKAVKFSLRFLLANLDEISRPY